MSLVLRQAGIRAVSQAVACAGVRLSKFFSASAAASSADELTVEVLPFKLHKLEEGPSTTVTTNKTELMEYFRVMATMRRMEIACDMMYKAKLIRGFCHLYDGQEAVITGLEAASNYGDSIITSYRDHCTHLGRGGTVYEVMAELMGKVDGASRGIGGSMHLYNKANNFYGGCGIVGAQIPLGAGMALAHKYNKTDNVAYTLYGDGAANQGQKYEAINIAALWELPCIFICENNHYGMGTAEWRAAKSATFFTRGDYIPGLKADGMDVLAVRQAISFAKKFVLENGPIILEVDTYRYHGHSMSDPGSTYRTREEITAMRQERDPIERVRKLLVNNGLAEAEELKQMEKKIKKEVDAAAEQAKKSPDPPNHFTWTNLYAKPDGVKMRGRDSQSWHEALVEPFPFPKHWTEKKQLFDF